MKFAMKFHKIGDTGNLAFLNKPLELTEHEKQWIKQHPDLKVLENPYSPPYSMTDENGSVRGVMGIFLILLPCKQV